MIQDTLRDVLRPANGPPTPHNCVVGQNISTHAIKKKHGEIGSRSASPSFGTLVKCVGGPVEWAGPAGNHKCSEFAS